jgi:hypothetical protein
MFSGLVAAEATAVVGKHRIREHISARRPVTTTEYDATALEVERGMTRAEFTTDLNVIPGHFDEAHPVGIAWYSRMSRTTTARMPGARVDRRSRAEPRAADLRVAELVVRNGAGGSQRTSAAVRELLARMRESSDYQAVIMRDTAGSFYEGLDLEALESRASAKTLVREYASATREVEVLRRHWDQLLVIHPARRPTGSDPTYAIATTV